MTISEIRLCTQCHARVAPETPKEICPSCGGALVPDVGPNLDPPGSAPQVVDHRGILLPRRHAVGGVITPR